MRAFVFVCVSQCVCDCVCVFVCEARQFFGVRGGAMQEVISLRIISRGNEVNIDEAGHIFHIEFI